jgi:2,4-diaminopentanoate dehydrogenase
VVGTGVNPGFAMDYLPVVLSGATKRVDAVRVHRVQDAGQRREPLQAKVGAGITTDEFARRVAAGSMGHVGLTESAQAVAAALGWDPADTTETIDPVLAETPTPSAFGTIEPGRVAGIDQVAVVRAGGVERVRLHLQMAVGIGPSQDDVWLTGEPDLHLVVPGGLHGDLATAAALVNTVGSIRHAEPGLRVMSELRPPRPAPTR